VPELDRSVIVCGAMSPGAFDALDVPTSSA
jgi:hypothetical protein